MTSRFCLPVICFLFTFGLNQQLFSQLSKSEKKIVKAVDKHTDASLKLLEKAVNINSGTMNFEGVREVGKLFQKELDKLGFQTQLTSGDSYGRAGHLIATHEGKPGLRLLLIGHLDTVFELDSPFQSSSMLNDSIMKAPGVADMKGGDVVIILAMQALKDAGVLDEMSVEIVMTGDEEKSGSPIELSKEDLVDAAKRADVALGFENGDGNPETIVISRRGSSSWKLEVGGNAAHSSQVFTEKVGAGAIYEASRILNEFFKQLSSEENLTFNPGFILGGTSVDVQEDGTGGTAFGKTNVVAQKAVIRGDIRAVSLDQLDRAKKIMNEIVSKNYPETQAILSFDDGGYPPLARAAGNEKLLEYYDEISQELGFGKVYAVNPRNAGAADISFTAGHVEMAADGLGLSGDDDHTINETGNLNMVSKQAKRAAILMYRLSQLPEFRK
ncbi:M20/M25/M40 family metallo-hydrolase [Gramella sp. GC03-9]|uniref:M20/M25/M40 family metallo-hydrolase n=1 Tax=Christiangramia oceanisediminis TaxID=2920386 RepID=A0A9X2I2U6_9FLAO|nr:M20/M25/M40 family metallo-hydrolase [Gramella oceanisediminis]MCP9198820.1 M20/M25/M40 family metallo-hydrolase [Gramella oceanisediminis]